MSTFETTELSQGSLDGDIRVTTGSIIARIERLPRNSMQVRARILIGAATFFDGFDVIIIAATLPLLAQKWSLSPTQLAFMLGSGSVGQLIGALLFPWLAERYGRVSAIAWSSGIIGATSIACAFAPTFAAFVVLRIIQGLGLGGELPVAATYINEVTRAHGRGRFVLLYEIVFPIGLLASSALGAWIVPRLGWQAMYFIAGAPLLLSFVLRSLVPESPRWLCERNRMEQANKALLAFENTVRGSLPPVVGAEEYDALVLRHPARRRRELFSPAYLKRTAAVALLWMTCGVMLYGLSAWLPTMYKTVFHVPFQTALNLAIGSSVLGVVGSLASALLVDIVGRKRVIIVSFALCAVSLVLAGALHTPSVWVMASLCSLASGFLSCGFITAYVYTPELYPTSIRAFGCGFAGACLKLASIFAPGLIAARMATGGLDVAFYVLGALPILAAFAIHFFGVETKEIVLEKLEV